MKTKMSRVCAFNKTIRSPGAALSTKAKISTARHDPRWPQITNALAELRAHRHSVRIVDADCACGTLLIAAVKYARELGFTAIEGRGIDGAPTMIGRARAAAALLQDPAIGLVFDLTDMVEALVQEAEFPADIVLCQGCYGEAVQPSIARLLVAAGDHVISASVARTVSGEAA